MHSCFRDGFSRITPQVLTPALYPARQHVEHLVNGPNVDVVGVHVLSVDVPDCPVDASLPDAVEQPPGRVRLKQPEAA